MTFAAMSCTCWRVQQAMRCRWWNGRASASIMPATGRRGRCASTWKATATYRANNPGLTRGERPGEVDRHVVDRAGAADVVGGLRLQYGQRDDGGDRGFTDLGIGFLLQQPGRQHRTAARVDGERLHGQCGRDVHMHADRI